MLGAQMLSKPCVTGPTERVQRELRQARAVGQLTVLSAPQSEVVADEPAPPSVPVLPVPAGIPDYENLSASQIVPLLRGLTTEERTEVLAYETATRGRKTIISALAKSGT
jgi:hypothetical protein